MSCPNRLKNQKIEIKSTVKNKNFFESHFVNDWTFKDFLKWSSDGAGHQIKTRLHEYKASLNSLKLKQSIEVDLSNYVAWLIEKKFTDAELNELKKPENPTISINSSSIIGSNISTGNIVINNNSVYKRKLTDDQSDERSRKMKILNTHDTQYNSSYHIKNINILDKWKEYKLYSNEYLKNNKIVAEIDLQKLLAHSHIMLLKKDQSSPDLLQFFDDSVLDGIKEDITKRFGINSESLPTDIEQQLKGILKLAINKSINPRIASFRMMACCTDNMDTNVDDVIFILRNLVERLPHKKTNETMKESQLSVTYVDALIRPFLDDPSIDNFLIWSNNILFENQPERPDFVSMQLRNTKFNGPSCIGEIKGEDKINDKYLAIVDLIRIAAMSKDSIDRNCYQGILGVHVVGFQATFYLTTLFAEGLYVAYEICSVSIPCNLQELRSFLAISEDLLPIKNILNQCKVKNNEATLKMKKEGISINQIKQLIVSGKDRKRDCPFTFH